MFIIWDMIFIIAGEEDSDNHKEKLEDVCIKDMTSVCCYLFYEPVLFEVYQLK